MGQAISSEKQALSVLLIEADAIDAKLVFLFSEAFQRFAPSITHVRDTKSALDAMSKHSFDIFLLDYWLKENNSLKFLFDMEQGKRRVPTIILSNITINEVDALRLTAGGALFLSKGVCSAKSLECAVENAFALAAGFPEKESTSSLADDRQRAA